MKIRQEHEQLLSACGAPTNPRNGELSGSFKRFGSHPGGKPFRPPKSRARPDSGFNPVIHLGRTALMPSSMRGWFLGRGKRHHRSQNNFHPTYDI